MKLSDNIKSFPGSIQGMTFDRDGILKYPPHNVVPYSSQFDNAAWVKSGTCAAVKSGALSENENPFYTVSGASDVGTSGNNLQCSVAQIFPGKDHTISLYLIAGTASSVTVRFRTTDGLYNTTKTFALTPNQTRFTFVVTPPVSGVGAVIYIGSATGTFQLADVQFNASKYALNYCLATDSVAYGPRFDYGGVPGAERGMLIEPIADNIVPASWDFSNWTFTATTRVANASRAPDGTQTMTRVVPSNTSAIHSFGRPMRADGLIQGATITTSVFAKPDQLSMFQISWFGGVNGINSAYANFNVDTGKARAFSGASVKMEQYRDGYICSATCVITGDLTAGTDVAINFISSLADGRRPTTQFNGTDGMYFAGMQSELRDQRSALVITDAFASPMYGPEYCTLRTPPFACDLLVQDLAGAEWRDGLPADTEVPFYARSGMSYVSAVRAVRAGTLTAAQKAALAVPYKR